MASSVSALWLATRPGKILLSFLLGTNHHVLQEKFPQRPNNKIILFWTSFSVKLARYWPRSFFASLWTSTPSQSVNMQKRTWPMSNHLDLTLVNYSYMIPLIIVQLVIIHDSHHVFKFTAYYMEYPLLHCMNSLCCSVLPHLSEIQF